jgi:ApbE superfamily uncharacterized protein (UPF0280 family)
MVQAAWQPPRLGSARRQLLPEYGDHQAARWPRWHFQDGPIDLVIAAEGEAGAVHAAHQAAWDRFEGLLAELAFELPNLRQPVQPAGHALHGPVAVAMWRACAAAQRAAQGVFITPMAAVAGAVADALIGAYQRPGIQRAWVNNGGDIALHLAPGQQAQVGLVADLGAMDGARLARTVAGQGQLDGHLLVRATDPVRGLATSGWRGRSHSLGIADSVTVLAANAATADACATLVANAVDLPHAGIQRQPAHTLKDDSDLGDLPVTVAVPTLNAAQAQQALSDGLALARALQAAGVLHAAVLVCQGCLARLAPVQPLQSDPSLVQ